MRFLTKQIDNGSLLGAYEEALFISRISNVSSDTIWLWRHPKIMYLLKNSSINYLDTDYAAEIGYPIVRSAVFSAKPTSVVIAGNDFGLSVYCKNLPMSEMVEKYYVGFWGFVTNGLFNIEHKNNDLVVEGTDRKILGMVNIFKDGVTAGHCMFSETIPKNIDLEKLFKMPKEKFSDKTVKSVSDRITSFYTETGLFIDDDWISDKAKEYFGSIGIMIEYEEDFNDQEKNIVFGLKDKHLNNEWIKYGKIYEKPDFI